ncbi:hypothetical protein DFH09DRAFT_1283549 [Mycena vulgaris]|nr:hypothetical protein DFH09DRAFT_1283549 [Mycena vulgaris]
MDTDVASIHFDITVLILKLDIQHEGEMLIESTANVLGGGGGGGEMTTGVPISPSMVVLRLSILNDGTLLTCFSSGSQQLEPGQGNRGFGGTSEVLAHAWRRRAGIPLATESIFARLRLSAKGHRGSGPAGRRVEIQLFTEDHWNLQQFLVAIQKVLHSPQGLELKLIPSIGSLYKTRIGFPATVSAVLAREHLMVLTRGAHEAQG